MTTTKKHCVKDTSDADLFTKLIAVNEMADECLAFMIKDSTIVTNRPTDFFPLSQVNNLNQTSAANVFKALAT